MEQVTLPYHTDEVRTWYIHSTNQGTSVLCRKSYGRRSPVKVFLNFSPTYIYTGNMFRIGPYNLYYLVLSTQPFV
jgi:hypothetical protein